MTFGDLTYKENLFSKEINSSLPRFSVLDTFNLHVVKQKPRGPNVLTKVTVQTRKRARLEALTPGQWSFYSTSSVLPCCELNLMADVSLEV